MMADPQVAIQPDETLWIRTNDKMVPDVPIEFGALGETPTVVCPRCEARIRLDGYWNNRPNVSSYPIHYVNEHVLPEIRYEETSS